MSDSEATAIKIRVIFACGDRPFTVRDVIDAALFRGELEPEWKNLHRLLAAEKKADEQDLEFDDAAIDATVERFRLVADDISQDVLPNLLGLSVEQNNSAVHEFGAFGGHDTGTGDLESPFPS